MRKRLPVMLAFALLLPAPASAAGWKLVFSDEFTGDALDRDAWATRYLYGGGTTDTLNDELQRYADKDNHRVADGALSLVARPVAGLGGRFKFQSGMIRSRQTFYYGYYEARVFLPDAKGVWPAFWFTADPDGDGDVSWPPEIDAFEYVLDGKQETPDMIHSAIGSHNKANRDDWRYRDPAFNPQWSFFRADKPLNRDWQVIGLLWKPDSVTSYINGRKLWTRGFDWVNKQGGLAGPAHILFNLAVGGSWAGRNGIDHAAFPQALKIDYIRVCQYVSGNGGAPDCGGSRFTPPKSEGAYAAPFGDLPRTRLVEARIDRKIVAPGGTMRLRYNFDAVPSGRAHQIRVTLLDKAGQVAASFFANPATPTNRWRGTQAVDHSFRLPSTFKAGPYAVMLSIGSAGAKGEWQNIPLTADGLGRADGWMRYKIGAVRVGS